LHSKPKGTDVDRQSSPGRRCRRQPDSLRALQQGQQEKIEVNGNDKGSSVAERSMGFGLRALNWLAGSDLLDRIRMRKQVERALFQGTKGGFRSATAAGRTFKAAQKLTRPARQATGKPRTLFDVTPDDEQQMFQEAVRDFAAAKVRPAAHEADDERKAPSELLDQVNELGVNMLGVPEELGGAMHEQAAATSVLVAEALAHGDMGIAYAALAPGAVATAIGHWGTAEQEATYLPAFSGEDVPAAALAMLEPRPLFDPLKLQTTAKRDGQDWILDGAKSLIARAAECELFAVAAAVEGKDPALFVIESGTKGLEVEDEPAMGLRPAATGRLLLEGVRLPSSAMLGEGKREDYVECVQRARIAWSALAVGASQAVLDYVIPYVNERTAFGEPVSNRQAVAFAVSDIGIETDGMRLATYRAASRADQGQEFAREAALARRLCAAKGMQIGSDGVQLLGGHGFVKEHPVERWYRDLRAAGVMEGALLV
jgi:alkylation response protein AidB-like acyl-CoA dehydrogenase